MPQIQSCSYTFSIKTAIAEEREADQFKEITIEDMMKIHKD